MVNLRNVDLNLLVVLHAVLEEAHITRAARRLGMSQPAVSNALDRCRALFDDRLIERRGRSMDLTARGMALREPLAQTLAGFDAVLGQQAEDLRTIERSVRVVLPEPLAPQFIAELAGPLAREAPGVLPIILRWQAGDGATHALERGEAELAVSGGDMGPVSEPISLHELGGQPSVNAMRVGHPAGTSPSLEQWLAWPHIVVSTQGQSHTTIDDMLAERGLKRRVGLVVPNFTLALDAVRVTDYIAQLPEGVAQQYPGEIMISQPPLQQGPLVLRLLRHRRSSGDVAVDFLADHIVRIFGQSASG